jgi:hypothetical protein
VPAVIKVSCPRRFMVSDLLRDFEFAAVLGVTPPGRVAQLSSTQKATKDTKKEW